MGARWSRPRRAPTVAPEPRTTIDPIALAQLWADQFQHLATLGVAGAGGLLILLQAGLLDREEKWWLALGFFALTAVLSLYGQIIVVDEATLGRVPGTKPRALRGVALLCLGAAGGVVIGVTM